MCDNMTLVTISLKQEVINHYKIKTLTRNRKLSSTINKLLKKHIKLAEIEDKNVERPYISIPKQEFQILSYMLENKINNIDTETLAKRIYNKGIFRQKKRIHDTVRRIISETGMYRVDSGTLFIELINCPCGAQISPFALKSGKCIKCNRLLIGVGVN